MGNAKIVLEIILLLQGTPLDDFARDNFAIVSEQAVVRCASTTTLPSEAGVVCKRSVATALRRYSYLFTMPQLNTLAELFVYALDHLEPEALARVREQMCDTNADESRRDGDAARAVCLRLSQDF